MAQKCDNTSVGILVFQDEKLLMINRKKPPFGMAPPAGHVDDHGEAGDSEEVRFEKAARAELSEETGLQLVSLIRVAEGRKENVCRREGGSWHFWRIYRADAEGKLNPSTEETLGAFWLTAQEIESLLSDELFDTPTGHIGIESIWKEWFEEIDILSMF